MEGSGALLQAMEAYAAHVATSLACCGSGSVSLVEAAMRLEWLDVRVRPLAAREGRQDALLCPRRSGGFVVVVDPALAPADRARGLRSDAVLEWRLAHELGHTFFFTRDTPPMRWRAWSPEEEGHADRFASLVLSKLGKASRPPPSCGVQQSPRGRAAGAEVGPYGTAETIRAMGNTGGLART